MTRLEQLQNLLAASPKDSFLLFAIAKEHEKANDDARALDYYLQVRAATPDYVGLYYHLGKLYERTQRPEQAADTYEEGIKVATTANDRHTVGELQTALWEVED